MITFSPTAKILLYIFLIITVFFSNSFKADAGILILVFIFTFGIPVSVLKRGLIPITLFLAFTFFSNILFQSGRVIYEMGGIAVTEEGLRRGGHLTLRLFILILGAKALTGTTKAEELIRAINVLLGPLGRWEPLREFMSTMVRALSFLPIIYDEAQTLYAEAVKNSPETTFLDKIKLSVSLLTPLFERSLKRAKDLSVKNTDFTD